MYASSPISRLLLLIALFWNEFLPWYLTKHPLYIIKRFWQYTCACWEIFSIIFLIKTLFAPWKNITDEYPENMFQLGLVFQVFTMNAIARCVGAVMRTFAILFGLCIQVLLTAYFLAYLLLWIAFPFIVALGVPYLLANII